MTTPRERRPNPRAWGVSRARIPILDYTILYNIILHYTAICPCHVCGSLAENRGELRRLSCLPCEITNKYRGVIIAEIRRDDGSARKPRIKYTDSRELTERISSKQTNETIRRYYYYYYDY